MAVLSRIIGPRLIGVIAVALLVPLYFQPHGEVAPPGAPAAQVASPPSPWASRAPVEAVNAFTPTTVIQRDVGGTFHVAGAINGRSLDMLVDTGASLVAIPATQAPELGVIVQPDDFHPVLRTASGSANGATTRIASLVIGQRELRDVEAVVVEGLDRVLLGQSALSRLGRVTISGDHMEIAPE